MNILVVVCMACFRTGIAPTWWTDGIAGALRCPWCNAQRLQAIRTDKPTPAATVWEWPEPAT